MEQQYMGINYAIRKYNVKIKIHSIIKIIYKMSKYLINFKMSKFIFIFIYRF